MTDHGFRFCYPHQLIDPESLMSHFRQKVGVEHSCLHCGKRFKSLNAVRDHMIGKSHCNYELNEEYEEFYQLNTGLVVAPGSLDAVGELHLGDKVYGHRMYQRYYKQRCHDPEEMERMRRPALTGPVAPRKSVTLAKDATARKKVIAREKYDSSRQRRRVTKLYNPFTDILRGDA
jgi:hypothetical protein